MFASSDHAQISIGALSGERFISGIGITLLVVGAVAIAYHLYLLKSKNRNEYTKVLRNEKRGMNDERSIMLRGQASACTILAMMMVFPIIAVTLRFMHVERWVISLIGGLFWFQLLLFNIFYFWLRSRD